MTSILKATAVLACFSITGCSDLFSPIDGAIPFFNQRDARYERVDGEAITVDGRSYLVTRVTVTYQITDQSNRRFGQTDTREYDEVNVRGQRVNCHGTPEDCVRRVRAAVQQLDSGGMY